MKRNKAMNRKHGVCKSEYSTWTNMKTRCYNKRNPKYRIYGARGIKVCNRWLHSFENFYHDMGAKPTKYHSIERINNDGNYEPSNCRWATTKEQAKNKRQNHFITYNGITKPISHWADDLGIRRNTLNARINNYNWSIDKALTTRLRLFNH